ncbi:MAG: TatD family hydrolase [Anaerolineales bacterium]
MIDTHCHLDFESFDADRPRVVERALEAGVGMIVNPSIDLENATKVIVLAEEFESVYATVGVHPNSSIHWNEDSGKAIKDLSKNPKVVAIGEIGLDYFRERAPHELQKEVVRAQLKLAAELELPVIIHNREAEQDVIEILMDWCEDLVRAGSPLAERPGVLHSFSGSREMADRAVDANFMIGFTGPITFKNAEGAREIAAAVPIENIFIETDSPFLTPHPFRGERNEPARVKLIAEKIAEVKQIPFETVGAATTENAQHLFRFEDKR